MWLFSDEQTAMPMTVCQEMQTSDYEGLKTGERKLMNLKEREKEREQNAHV